MGTGSVYHALRTTGIALLAFAIFMAGLPVIAFKLDGTIMPPFMIVVQGMAALLCLVLALNCYFAETERFGADTGGVSTDRKVLGMMQYFVGAAMVALAVMSIISDTFLPDVDYGTAALTVLAGWWSPCRYSPRWRRYSLLFRSNDN